MSSRLKRLMKKSEQDRQSSPPSTPSHDRPKEEAQGFICPMCMASLPSADDLQQHFSTIHDATQQSEENGALRDLSPTTFKKLTQNELEMNKQLLKASDESRTLLGAEVHSLQSRLKQLEKELSHQIDEKNNCQTKAAMLAGELAACKARADESEGKRVAHEDHITTLKVQLSEKTKFAQLLETQLAERPSADDVLVLKKELVQVQSLMDASVQDMECNRMHLTNELTNTTEQLQQSLARIQELEVDIAARPRDDDIHKLQTLLSERDTRLSSQTETLHQCDLTIQQLHSQLDQEKKNIHNVQKQLSELESVFADTRRSLDERTVQHDSLQKKFASKEEQLEKNHSALIELQMDLAASKSTVESLREELSSMKLSLQESRLEHEQEIGAARIQFEKTCTLLDSKSTQFEDVSSQLKALKEQLQNQCSMNDELQGRLREKDMIIESELRNAASSDEKIATLERDLASSIATTERQEVERNELLLKIETGEGTDTAIHQLQTENVLLQEKVTSLEKSLKDESEDSRVKQEQLHVEVREMKDQLQVSQEKGRKVKNLVMEKDEKITKLEQRIHQLECDVQTKNELYMASDASKTAQRLDLESHIHTIQSSLVQKTDEAKQLKATLEQMQVDYRSTQESIRLLEQTVQEERAKLGDSQQLVDTLQKQVKWESEQEEELSNYKTQFRVVEEKNQSLLVQLSEATSTEGQLKESEQLLHHQVAELTEKNDALSKKTEHLLSHVDRLTSDLHEQQSQHALQAEQWFEKEKIAQEELTQAKSAFKDLQRDNEELAENLRESAASITSCQDRIQQLETEIVTLNSNNLQLEEGITNMTNKYNDVDLKRQLLEKDAEEIKKTKSDLETSIKESLQAEKDMTLRQTQLEQDVTRVQAEKDVLLTEKESTDEKLGELESQKNEAEMSLADLTDRFGSLQMQHNKLSEELSELQVANDLLISQKLQLQTHSVQLEEEKHLALNKTEAVEERLQKSEINFQEEKTTLESTLSKAQERFDALERARDENKVRHELQMTTLNENLTIIRTELTMTQDSLETSTKLCDDLRGQKLELEAKLDNNSDERRVLLERCLESEAECEKLRTKNTDLQRKLEDTQGALHDLGRENQSLQITTVKAQNRRWADDNEVSECITCSKLFSVTIRKHHCRNCGNIFCADCSSRLAPIPSSKKPVRVCDTCYVQLLDR